MRSDRKQTILFIIILLVLSLGIGYAFLTTTLSIDGVSDIDSANWDVHFENVQVKNGSVTGSQVITPATIGSNTTSVSFHIKLAQPGDYYDFTVDAVNAGTLDATIDSVSFKVNDTVISNNMSYYNDFLAIIVSYDDYENSPIFPNQWLMAGNSSTYRIRVSYFSGVNPEDLPTENQSIPIELDVTYKQGKMCETCYLSNLHGELDVIIPEHASLSSTYQEAISAMNGVPLFLKARVNKNDNLFEDMTLGFVKNGNVYYLTPGGSTYDPITYDYSESIYYADNVSLLNSLFDSSLCAYDSGEYCCEPNNGYVCVKKDGTVIAYYNSGIVGYLCQVETNGDYFCKEHHPH